MHDAWVRWSAAWGANEAHAGILIIPQEWRPPAAAAEIARFIGPHVTLSNAIHAYDVDAGQWVRDPVPKRR